jgi:hypothetical protein
MGVSSYRRKDGWADLLSNSRPHWCRDGALVVNGKKDHRHDFADNKKVKTPPATTPGRIDAAMTLKNSRTGDARG